MSEAADASARRYARFDDFRLSPMTVERIRYVGGFGSIAWVDVAAYRDADVDS